MFFLNPASRGFIGKADHLLTAATILLGSAVCHTTLFVAPALSSPTEQRLLILPSQNLPASVLSAVKRSLAQKLNRPESSLSIQLVSASRRTWPDSCLGLGRGTICAQVLVPGWLVKVSTSGKVYTYRTNANGGLVIFQKVEVASNSQEALPPSVRDAVLREVNRGLGGGLQLLIYSISGSKQVWPNGCLGLPSAGEICSGALVPGWRVEVETFSSIKIYRTNSDGSVVRFEGTKPRPIPTCPPNKLCL